jgi:hypothetical protein
MQIPMLSSYFPLSAITDCFYACNQFSVKITATSFVKFHQCQRDVLPRMLAQGQRGVPQQSQKFDNPPGWH